MVAAIVPEYASLFMGHQRGTRAQPARVLSSLRRKVYGAAMKGRARNDVRK